MYIFSLFLLISFIVLIKKIKKKFFPQLRLIIYRVDNETKKNFNY
jgi:hypothetical protein